jgi:maltooligosyltrehalose trehalohydrolase
LVRRTVGRGPGARRGGTPILSEPELGATAGSAGVDFRVWAPKASRVDLDLVESGEAIGMQRDGEGVWSTRVATAKPGTRYFFRLNGELRRPDPYSRYQPEGVHGPSEVVDPRSFEWHDDSWRGLDIHGLVIYQVHVGTATPEGTLDSLVGQLARLQKLGVGAVQLLPLAEFPGTRNWGYDSVDLFAVSNNYGGPEALRRFVDAAHQEQLGVILDVIYNHFGPDGNYLRDFSNDYFTEHYHTPWGEAVNYDGPDSRWVRKLVVDNVRYWLNEYHADGLRFDATHAIYDSSSKHILAEATDAARQTTGRKSVVLIAETGENDPRYVQATKTGGLGFDAVYAEDFHHTLRRYLAGDHEGYYADFEGTLDEVARCIEQGWLFEGQPTPRSNGEERRGKPAHDLPAWNFLYVLQNHDQVGNRALGERLHHQIGVDRFAAASALLLFLPYTPMLFMGQEFAASAPFQYFTDHNPELGKLVTEGRRREFKAFSAFADAATREKIPDPQAESTFANSKLRLSEADSPPGSELQAWYAALLRLRRTDPVLVDQDRTRTAARALSKDVLAVRRWRDEEERLLIVNFGDAPFETSDFGNGWSLVLAQQTGSTDDARITIPSRTALVVGRSGS